MLDTFRKCRYLVGKGQATRWIALAVLAVTASGFEMLGAALILLLLRLVGDPNAPLDLPLLGDVERFLPAGSQKDLLAATIAVLAVFFLFRAGLLVLKAYGEHRIANNAGARLGARLAHGYLSMPYSFHLQRSSAELIRNAYHTVTTVVNQVLTPAASLVADIAMVIGLVFLLLITSPIATGLAMCVMAPLVILLLRVVHPRLRRLGTVSQVEATASLQSLRQSLEGFRDIRLLGRERYFGNEFAATRRRYARAQYLRGVAFQLPRIMIETALVLFVLALFALLLIGDSPQETVAVIGLFAYVGLRLQPSLQRIVFALNNIRFAGPAIDDLYADLVLMEQPHEDRSAKGSIRTLEHSLRLEGLSFSYESADRPSVEHIDLVIRRGESMGIVGPTGGGKSTLIDLITGLLAPTTGRMLVDGVDIRDDLPGWHARLGVVSQSVFLVDDTLRRNIALGETDEAVDEERVLDAVSVAQLSDVVEALPEGLHTRIGERGIRLSGGQRQRVAIARALYRRPDVLIFDEGTSALDSTTEAELVTAIERLREDRTIITVAHRLTTVRRCDRIVFLEDGRVTAVGDFDELVRGHEAFQRMTTSQ